MSARSDNVFKTINCETRTHSIEGSVLQEVFFFMLFKSLFMIRCLRKKIILILRRYGSSKL